MKQNMCKLQENFFKSMSVSQNERHILHSINFKQGVIYFRRCASNEFVKLHVILTET